jgi:pentose-5-phosphate-3-epimerase
MSVEPGKGGQPFLPSALAKLLFLKKELAKEGLSKKRLARSRWGHQ